MQIIGIYVYDGNKAVLKNLHENTWYPFCKIENCEEIFTDKELYTKVQDELKNNRCFSQNLYCFEKNYSPFDNKKTSININCIVGKNGSGKSTLLKIYYGIINNFACKINENMQDNSFVGFEPRVAYGFNASLYFELDGEIGCIKIENNTIDGNARNSGTKVRFFYKDEIDFTNIKTVPDLQRNIFNNFFYTIATNYSFYSYSSPNDIWIDNVFQKNDGYFTPLVLVPYRYNNTIEFDREYYLAQERVKVLSLLLYLSTKESFFEDYFPCQISYVLKDDYKTDLRTKILELLNNQFKNLYSGDEIDDVENNEIVTKLKDEWKKRLLELDIKETSGEAYNAVLLYLCYKTIKIFKNYGKQIFPNFSLLDNSDEIILHLSDKSKLSHINLKIIQCINFLKDSFFKMNDEENIVEVDNFVKYFKSKEVKVSYENIFIHLPPSFFDMDIEYRKENTSETMHLYDLSSGEEQFLFSVSYFVYHIKNIESVQNDLGNRIFYKNVSLVLDEAELYYHPEYQRMFIKKMLDIFKKTFFRNIDSINITIVTHSPFMISDIPMNNVLCLKDGLPDKEVLGKTLGANIYDLLKNQFFMESSIGGVSEKIINNIINLYGERNKNGAKKYEISKEFIRQFINKIGDAYLKGALESMFNQIDKNRLD